MIVILKSGNISYVNLQNKFKLPLNLLRQDRT